MPHLCKSAARCLRKNLENMETAPVSYVIFMTESARQCFVGLGCMAPGKHGIAADMPHLATLVLGCARISSRKQALVVLEFS